MKNKKLEILVVEDTLQARAALIGSLLEKFSPNNKELNEIYIPLKKKIIEEELKGSYNSYKILEDTLEKYGLIELIKPEGSNPIEVQKPYSIQDENIRIDSFPVYDSALESMKTHHYDGVITDLSFPFTEKCFLEDLDKNMYISGLNNNDIAEILKDISPQNAKYLWKTLLKIGESSFITEAIDIYDEKYSLTTPDIEYFKKLLETENNNRNGWCYGNLIALEATKRGVPVVVWTEELYHAKKGIILGIGQGLFDCKEIADGLSVYKSCSPTEKYEKIWTFSQGKVPLVVGGGKRGFINENYNSYSLGAEKAVEILYNLIKERRG